MSRPPEPGAEASRAPDAAAPIAAEQRTEPGRLGVSPRAPTATRGGEGARVAEPAARVADLAARPPERAAHLADPAARPPERAAPLPEPVARPPEPSARLPQLAPPDTSRLPAALRAPALDLSHLPPRADPAAESAVRLPSGAMTPILDEPSPVLDFTAARDLEGFDEDMAGDVTSRDIPQWARERVVFDSVLAMPPLRGPLPRLPSAPVVDDLTLEARPRAPLGAPVMRGVAEARTPREPSSPGGFGGWHEVRSAPPLASSLPGNDLLLVPLPPLEDERGPGGRSPASPVPGRGLPRPAETAGRSSQPAPARQGLPAPSPAPEPPFARTPSVAVGGLAPDPRLTPAAARPGAGLPPAGSPLPTPRTSQPPSTGLTPTPRTSQPPSSGFTPLPRITPATTASGLLPMPRVPPPLVPTSPSGGLTPAPRLERTTGPGASPTPTPRLDRTAAPSGGLTPTPRLERAPAPLPSAPSRGAFLPLQSPPAVTTAPPPPGARIPGASTSGGLSPTPRIPGASTSGGLSPTPRIPGASTSGGLSPTPRIPGASTSGGLSPTPRIPGASTSGGLSPTPRSLLPIPSPVLQAGPGGGASPSVAPPAAAPSLARTPPPATGRGAAVAASTLVPLTGEAQRDPLSPAVTQWLADLSRAVRGCRLYAENNAMFRGFVDVAYRGLTELLGQRVEITITVADDHLGFAGDVVHQSTDRLDGLPSMLFQSALRTLQFRRGMPREELVAIVRAMGGDYGSAHLSGEDLVTNLWRLASPHLSYGCARVLTKAPPKLSSPRVRLANVEGIVGALSASPPLPDDVRGFLAGTPEQIVGFERLHGATGADLDLLRLAALFNQVDTHPLEREDFVRELEHQDQPVELSIRLFERVLAAVLDERGETEDSPSTAVLLHLFDALLEAGHFASLTSLVSRLTDPAPASSLQTLDRARVTELVLPLLVTGERIRRVLGAYSEAMAADESGGPRADAILSLLRALSTSGIDPVLDHLDAVARSPWRRVVLSLLTTLEVPTASALHRRMAAAKHWSLACDFLSLTALLPPDQAAPLVVRAGKHPDPHVRAESLRLLLAHDDPQVEALVVQRLRDADREVRVAALALALREKGDAIAEAMDAAMGEDDFVSRDAEELRLWCTTLTALWSFKAVPALSRLLQPSLLSALKPAVEAQVAAVESLGSVDHPAARAHLGKALRSLNKTVRTAAKRALEQSELLGFSTPEPLGAEGGAPRLESGPVTQRNRIEAVTPEAFGHEVRDVISSLFGDEAPLALPTPEQRALPPGARAERPDPHQLPAGHQLRGLASGLDERGREPHPSDRAADDRAARERAPVPELQLLPLRPSGDAELDILIEPEEDFIDAEIITDDVVPPRRLRPDPGDAR